MSFATATTDLAEPLAGPPAPSRAVFRRQRTGRVVALVVAVLVLAGCSAGPGSQEEFIEVLTRDGVLTDEEATCISGAVFDRYAEDGDALGKISAAPDFEYLSSDQGVDGFAQFFDETVRGCAKVGPTSE